MKTAPDQKISYNDYLKTHELLSLQEEVSQPKHPDELLFITIHQSHELWFKLLIHEIKRLIHHFKKDRLFDALKQLNRIHTTFKNLLDQINVIDTLTPDEFCAFRDYLAPASGFQSYQYRIIEYLLGIKDPKFLKFNRQNPEVYRLMEENLHEKSVHDEFIALLYRRGFKIPVETMVRNFAEPYVPNNEIAEEIKKIYDDRDHYSDLHLLCEQLIDLDSTLQQWRMRHLKLAERTIGLKMGTGGSKGVEYLYTVLSKRCFPEIWDVRALI